MDKQLPDGDYAEKSRKLMSLTVTKRETFEMEVSLTGGLSIIYVLLSLLSLESKKPILID